ncbi:MAG TPA: hypothetical protein VJR03_00465 [Nitrospira sp.]|nr:hypothetical protein [Nitrospira sp.]
MGWHLFTGILAAGVMSMVWFLFLSIIREQRHWRPIAQPVRRHLKDHRRDGTLANG